MAAKLTAQLLRAGFAAESAARLVNVALGLKGAEQEAGATLDLLTAAPHIVDYSITRSVYHSFSAL